MYITTRTQISSKPINGPIVIADKELNLVLTWNSALTNFTLVVIQNKCQWIALYKCVFQPFTRYISTLVFMQSNKCVMIFGIMYTLFSNKLTSFNNVYFNSSFVLVFNLALLLFVCTCRSLFQVLFSLSIFLTLP